MSYDISFKAKIEGVDKYVGVWDPEANITWNVGEMIRKSTGLPWKNEENNGLCVNVMPYITKGINELETHPEKYKKYEAKNGWGTVAGCLNFFRSLVGEWKTFMAIEPELSSVATFWIE